MAIESTFADYENAKNNKDFDAMFDVLNALCMSHGAKLTKIVTDDDKRKIFNNGGLLSFD